MDIKHGLLTHPGAGDRGDQSEIVDDVVVIRAVMRGGIELPLKRLSDGAIGIGSVGIAASAIERCARRCRVAGSGRSSRSSVH